MIERTRIRLEQFHIYESWCTPCKGKTPHLFAWYKGHWLTCLQCKPEAKEIVKDD